MRSVLYILLLFAYSKSTVAYVYYNVSSSFTKNVTLSEPLILTDYLEKGLIAEAQEKARVTHPAFAGMESYSGFITINKTYNSNTFFWFFPSQTNPKEDPVILWMIGGPALTGLVAIFGQNGPLKFQSKDIMISRNYTLTVNHSVIYIDNPVGTGFSFTDDVNGFAKNQTHVGRDTILFLEQFFQIFPQYREKDFYIGGDSYGGKFVASVGSAVRKHNYQSKFYINFRGVIIGNGLINLWYQRRHADYFYNIGLIDKKDRDYLKDYEEKEMNYDLMTNLTGFEYYNNIMLNKHSYGRLYEKWCHTADFRNAVHAGTRDITFSSDLVRSHFEPVFGNPVTEAFEDVLQHNYRVLVYNGQLDFLFPYTSSQNMYEHLNWPHVQDYINADRKQWWVDGKLAGYVKIAGNFHEAFVRAAGHVTFLTQPKWTCELITRYTHNRPIAQGQPEFNFIRPTYFSYF